MLLQQAGRFSKETRKVWQQKSSLQKIKTLLFFEKGWFDYEDIWTFNQRTDFLVQKKQHPHLSFVLLVSSISFGLGANYFFSGMPQKSVIPAPCQTSVSLPFPQKWTPKTVQTKLKYLIFWLATQTKIVLLIREIRLFAGRETGSSRASSGYRTQPGLKISALSLRIHQWATPSIK